MSDKVFDECHDDYTIVVEGHPCGFVYAMRRDGKTLTKYPFGPVRFGHNDPTFKQAHKQAVDSSWHAHFEKIASPVQNTGT